MLMGTGVSTNSILIKTAGTFRLRVNSESIDFFSAVKLIEGEPATLTLTRSGNDLTLGIEGGSSDTKTFASGAFEFDMLSQDLTQPVAGIYYNLTVGNRHRWLGTGNTDADWLDQIGSNDGTVTGGDFFPVLARADNPAIDVFGGATQYPQSAYPVLPNITGGTAEALTAFNTNVATGGVQPPAIANAGIPATWVQLDGSVPLLQVKDNGDSTSSLALGFEDAPTVAEQLTIDEYYE